MLFFCSFLPFLIYYNFSFSLTEGAGLGQQQKWGKAEGSWGDPEFGVCGNNQYANHLTIPKQFNMSTSSILGPTLSISIPMQWGTQKHSVQVSRRPGRVPAPLCPHVHTLVWPPRLSFLWIKGTMPPSGGVCPPFPVEVMKPAVSRKEKEWKLLGRGAMWTGIKRSGLKANKWAKIMS